MKTIRLLGFLGLFWSSNIFAQESQMLRSDLPVVKSASRIYSSQYPGASEFVAAPRSSLQDYERNFQNLKEKVRLSPTVDTQFVVSQAKNDPERLNDIAKTVYKMASHPSLTYAYRQLNETDYTNIGLVYLDTLDKYRVIFSSEDIQNLTTGPSVEAIKQAVEGNDLTWVFNVFNEYSVKRLNVLSKSYNYISKDRVLLQTLSPKHWVPMPKEWVPNALLPQRIAATVQDDIINHRLTQKNNVENPIELQNVYTKLKEDVSRSQLDQLEVFLKGYTEYIDPHSLYLAPNTKNIFSSQLTNVLKGVGISWEKDDKTSVVSVQSLVSNGPAARSKKIDVGDQLLSLGEQIDKMESIDKMPFQEIIDRIRGETGTSVYFLIKKKNGLQEIVSLAREVIPLEDNKAEAKNIMFNGTRFLVLEIPSFYRDEENPDRIGGSLSFDVSNLIKQNNGFDVLLLDLRNNGGGSLSEAIAMVSLFVDGGVAVQVKMPNGTVNPINVKENAKIWDGPMVTLINRRSASASEILAAALQDYERSLIVGETTYGKGSAQTLFDLDGWAKMPVSVYGQVNLTTMMFFRPSGQTTQKKGVVPDVWIGENRDPSAGVESRFERAITPETVENQIHNINHKNNFWKTNAFWLQEQSIKRWNEQPWFNDWKKLEEFNKESFTTEQSLLYDVRKSQYDTINASRINLNVLIKKQSESLNDNLNGDIVLRESLSITKDAMKNF